MTNLEVSVSRAYENNIALYGVGSPHTSGEKMREIAKTEIRLSPPYDKGVTRMLDIGKLIEDPVPGVYRITVKTDAKRRRWSWAPELEPIEANRLVALTDLGIAAAVDGSGERCAYVAVCSLSSGKPVEGADVALLTKANQIAGTGVTAENGAVRIDFAPEYDAKGDAPRGVLVTTGSDISYVSLSSSWYNQTVDSHRGVDPDGFSEPMAYVFAGRDIVRPGERFDMSILARTAPKAGLGVLAGAPVDLVLSDSHGDKFSTMRVTTDENGFASAYWDIPSGAPSGMWDVECRLGEDCIGSMSFKVSTYVPDRIRASLSAEKESVIGYGAANRLTADANYYFGSPVKEGTFRLVCQAMSSGRNPGHWEGWDVGLCDYPFSGETVCAYGMLDGESVVYEDPGVKDDVKFHAPIDTVYRFEVTPPAGRTVSAFESVVTYPTDRFIGVREGKTLTAERARVFELKILPVDEPDDDELLVADDEISIEVKLVKREWRHHYVKQSGSVKLEWSEDEISHPELTKYVSVPKGADLKTWLGRLAWEEEDLSAGRWQLTASSSDGSLITKTSFWHWKGEVSERSQSPASLNLESDAESYLPGSRAAISFRSGFSGRAYVAVGWKGLEQAFSLKVEKGLNTIPLEIPADVKGGAYYVTVTLVTENAPRMRRLSGMAVLDIDQASAHRLNVGLGVPEKVEPGMDLDVSVTLFDAEGKLTSGMVQIFATDEGVLALTGFESPDPFEAFYNFRRGLPYGTYDLYSLVYPDLEILPNGEIGGDVALASRLMKDGKTRDRATVALLSAPVKVGPDGSASVRLSVPDTFTGELRVMAVASTAEAVGAKEKPVKVRSKAGIEPLVPRYVAGGDIFRAKAVLFNHDLPAGEFRCTASCCGQSQVFEGILEKGGQKIVEMPVSLPVGAKGEVAVDFALEIAGVCAKASETVTVRPRRAAVQEVMHLLLRPGEDLRLAPIERDFIDGEESITEYATPVATLSGAVDWLDSYPYGCLEQTAAKAFPFLAIDDLVKLGLAKGENAREEARKRIEVARANILSMRQYDGGFSMWPNGDDTWTEGTLFAKHLFAEARAVGLLEDDPAMRNDPWLVRVANRGDRDSRDTAAYAAYILAVMGDGSFLQPARNIIAAPEKDRARFLAAAALVRGGYASEGEGILSETLREGTWKICESGDKARAAGMALYVAAKAGAGVDDIAPLVSALNAMLRKDGRAWGTTSDNAWAALGLATAGARMPIGEMRLVRVSRIGIERNPRPRNLPVAISRIYRNEAGEVVTSAKRGELLTAEIRFTVPTEIENAVLCDMLPGGLEIEDSSLKTRASSQTVENGDSVRTPWGHSEIRDDRWLWFGSIYSCMGEYVLKYRVRAVTPGVYAVGDVTFEDMYDPDMVGAYSTEAVFTVD